MLDVPWVEGLDLQCSDVSTPCTQSIHDIRPQGKGTGQVFHPLQHATVTAGQPDAPVFRQIMFHTCTSKKVFMNEKFLYIINDLQSNFKCHGILHISSTCFSQRVQFDVCYFMFYLYYGWDVTCLLGGCHRRQWRGSLGRIQKPAVVAPVRAPNSP